MLKTVKKFMNLHILGGFREFIGNSNALSLAVGVVIGAAFKQLVDTVMSSFVYPLVLAVFGEHNINGFWNVTINDSTIYFGNLFASILNFLLLMFAVYFVIITPVNKLAKVANLDLEIQAGAKTTSSSESAIESLQTIERLLIENNRLLSEKQQAQKGAEK